MFGVRHHDDALTHLIMGCMARNSAEEVLAAAPQHLGDAVFRATEPGLVLESRHAAIAAVDGMNAAKAIVPRYRSCGVHDPPLQFRSRRSRGVVGQGETLTSGFLDRAWRR